MKPWHKVVTPREDLREGRPLDASEFAVHLDKVRDGKAPPDYQNPEQFFQRTYLTQNLSSLAVETLRRLSGEKTETSAVFNLATQFGGGKTHALTLLFHLAQHGPKANSWQGVRKLLERANLKNVPKAATAVFVGTEFDSIDGRGGADGTPLRKTPWGEIAFQLGGAEGFKVVEKHDNEGTAPAGDVIRKFLPKTQPCLILMDELMNFVSRSRKSGMATQLYNFLQNLSETVRGEDGMVLAVSIPASELEMNPEDHADFDRFKKLLDRLGKAIVMSAESETSEIIRRRLFEWGGLPDDARRTITEYVDWVGDHRQQLGDFPIDTARQEFEESYPFHPRVLSVFRDKWQALPRFQQTRGVLRLLALWVSKAYQDGYKGGTKDGLISLGTAPMEDSMFRAALFEQLGESRLEVVTTTDICGKREAHAEKLDKEAVDAIKKSKLHRKVATSVFFESNGGMTKNTASLPEIRAAVGEPDLDIGHLDTVLENLVEGSYYFRQEKSKYFFSLKVGINKIFTDRKASVKADRIRERVREEVTKAFPAGVGVERVFFPEKSSQIPDRPLLTLIVMASESGLEDKRTLAAIGGMTRECGTSARTFKSALIWTATEGDQILREEARRAIAWEEIQEEASDLSLDDVQRHQVAENVKKAARDVKEAVWRCYKNVAFLDKDNTIKVMDLGLLHSSSAGSLAEYILQQLRQQDEITDGYSPNKLAKLWPATEEWSTKGVRDAFYASPLLPRLMRASAVQATIAQGVSNKVLAYVGKASDESYEPFQYGTAMDPNSVDISEDFYIIRKETAEAYLEARKAGASRVVIVEPVQPTSKSKVADPPIESGEHPTPTAQPWPGKVRWSGEIPNQKWAMFYGKVLTKYSTSAKLKLTVSVEATSSEGISPAKLEETKAALRELGLDDTVETE